MTLKINTNIAAMNAHNNMVKNGNALSSSLQKLSSGLRINKAADDASGMAIADSLRSQSLGLGQAIRNANDGISMVQTADGALEESINIVNTVKTKAIQAAQDGQTTESRVAIQADINKLMEQLDNIARTTAFNNQKLLSGNFTNKAFQIGAYSQETVNISIASSESTKIGHVTSSTLEFTGVGTTQLSLYSNLQDKTFDLHTIDLAYDNTRENSLGAVADAINKLSDVLGISAEAVVQSTGGTAVGTTDTALTETATVTFGALATGESVTVGGLTLTATDVGGMTDIEVAAAFAGLNASETTPTDPGKGEFEGTLTGWNAGAAVDEVVIFTSTTENQNVENIAIATTGTVGPATAVTVDGNDGTLTTDSNFSINGVIIGAVEVQANDANGALVKAINQKTSEHGVYASVDSEGLMTLTSVDGRAISVTGGAATEDVIGAVANMTTLGQINLIQAGSTQVQITENGDTGGAVSDVTMTRLSDVSVLTQEDAQTAIAVADSALKDLNKVRADLGSVQNQLTSTIANISVTRVNITAAESAIRDVDFAEEAANFSKFQILNQAGSFAMAQANATSQTVLSLLQG